MRLPLARCLLVCLAFSCWGARLPDNGCTRSVGADHDEVSLLQVSSERLSPASASWKLRRRSSLNSELQVHPNMSYQSFIDALPVWRVHSDDFTRDKFGKPRTETLPVLLRSFDWVILPGFGQDAILQGKDPKTVVVWPKKLQLVLDKAQRDWDSSHNNRVLVVGGGDEHASGILFGNSSFVPNATLALVRTYFRSVFYEALDVQIEGVRVAPIPLTEPYLRQTQEAAASAIFGSSTDLALKPRLVLAAWSHHWTHIEGLAEWGASRREAALWVSSNSARLAGVEVRDIQTELWWEELAKYRFMMAPDGRGIQSPKILEALLVLTIPIMQRSVAVVDLVRFGFPIVVVDEWSEITPERLDVWWSLLQPRLQNFRDRCINTRTYMSFFNGNLSSCA